MGLNGFEKWLHLGGLVHHVVRQEHTTGVEPRIHHVEETFVVRLPRIEEDDVKGSLQFGDLLERVTLNDADNVGQSGFFNVRGRFLRALRVVLNRDHVSARLARAEPEPDAAVTAGRPDLEHRLRAARRHQHAQEPAVFLRDRELSLVHRLDVFQQGFDLRRQRARRPLLCRDWSDGESESDERESKTHRERF